MIGFIIIVLLGFVIGARGPSRHGSGGGRTGFPRTTCPLSPARWHDACCGNRTIDIAKSAMMVTVAVVLTVPHIQAQAQTRTPDTGGVAKRVVILNATDPYLPAFVALDKAMRETIKAESRVPVELYAETLDMHRFPKTLLGRDLVALFRKKYRELKVDVVVADATIALEFAQRYREEIWPGAVIVFNSVPMSELGQIDLSPYTIGVPTSVEFGKTVDLALKLRPQTRRIAVVAGTAEPDRRYLALTRKSLEGLGGRIDIQYLVGLTLSETVTAVEALPADAVVLYLTMFRDGAGEHQVPRDVLNQISKVSRAPIFGVFETYLGYGIAAGSITTYEADGRAAGTLVARVLNGESPAEIGTQSRLLPECIADWRQLRHWRLEEKHLPPGCDIRFRQVSLWERYYWQALAVVAVFLAQTGLIVILMLNRRRLREMQANLEREYRRRSKAEAFAGRLREKLARFGKERTLGTMATAIAHEISQPLIAIQNYAQAVNRRVRSDDCETSKIADLSTKIERQAERAGTIIRRVRSLLNKSGPQLTTAPLSPLLEQVIRMMESDIEARECRIDYEPTDDLPAVLVDPLQIQLVLVNLLQNAMQSVCSGVLYEKSVTVDVLPIDNREIQISVTDRGAGIPFERADEIFDPMDSGTSVGMGMGLAISRDIIEANGGRIWYEPNPAGGAVFRFTLRRADQ